LPAPRPSSSADGEVDLVVGERGLQLRLARVGLGLAVLLDDDDAPAENFHLAAGGVLQAHHQPACVCFA
jgi:hypothetical protein